ncbi:MAG: T9SS type A sorting domain-containing protein [Bacteroidota bacterium]|nr:T9SS type A sorting domain-containing protein [Bacteroidota bacterium]
MKWKTLIGLLCLNLLMNAQPNWPLTKSNTTLQVALPAEFGVPYPQPLSVNGWEDGIHITRDGLNLYCIYLPADGLSWITNGSPCVFAPYQKGPTFGMDLTTSPVTVCPTWLHGDILISSRTSTSVVFPTWSLSNLNAPIYSEGAPQSVMLNSTTADLFVYTSNQLPPYKTDIYLAKNTSINPSAVNSTILPAPVTQTTTEDNPHIERLSANNLVLFFDSPDIPGGTGGLDLWYSTSNDDGLTWIAPLQVSSLNSTANEHQPHLYKDNLNQWWIYYTAPDISGKYAIYRAQQTIANNWNSWGPKQLVVGPGNTAGIGEPTLTQNGDLSFVVIYQDSNGTATDKFDADPWFLPHIVTSTVTEITEHENKVDFFVSPNPASNEVIISIERTNEPKTIQFFNSLGELEKQVLIAESSKIDISELKAGIYFISTKNNPSLIKKLIKLNP